MSGGTAYVLDLDGSFPPLVNKEMVALEDMSDPEDQETVLHLVRKHVEYTGSLPGQWVLDNWEAAMAKFVKVMPTDYKLALQRIKEEAQLLREKGELQEVVNG
jgi:glutamate synthase domain-containing protein 3